MPGLLHLGPGEIIAYREGLLPLSPGSPTLPTAPAAVGNVGASRGMGNGVLNFGIGPGAFASVGRHLDIFWSQLLPIVHIGRRGP
jgi:hypothetical protein